MQATGTVRKTEGEIAFVVVKRQSACGENCANCGGCQNKENELLVKDTIGVKPGDVVVVEMADKKILKAAFVFYILPLVIFILAYAGCYTFGFSEPVCIVAGVLVCVLFYTVLVMLDKRNADKYMHRIINVKKF